MQTFLVRVWQPADDRTCSTDLRGVVRQVTTGVETTFRGNEELLRLLRQPTAPPDGYDPRSPGATHNDERTTR